MGTTDDNDDDANHHLPGLDSTPHAVAVPH